MTDRMRDEHLDREIRNFLAWQAEDVGDAPTTTEMAMRLSSRVGPRTFGPRLAPQLGWVVLAVLLIVALTAAVLIGAFSRPAMVDGPPTNGWIAYSTRAHGATSGVQGEIFLVRDGIEPQRVAGGDGRLAVCPSFSPDGTKLSYVYGGNVFVLSVDAAGQVREESGFGFAGLVRFACPVWSPSGDAVAVLAAGEVVVHGQDGSITSLPVPDGAPVEFADNLLAWAPEGTSIALATTTGIWLIPVDGSPPQRLSTSEAFSLSWSPDGSQLAFHEQVEGPNGTVSVLTVGADVPVVALGPGSQPVWSADGGSIAYPGAGGRRGPARRWLGPSGLGVGNGYGFGGWSPDGKWLLQMVDVSGQDWDLMAAPANGASHSVIARQISTGSARNFPNLGDVSWQAVYR